MSRLLMVSGESLKNLFEVRSDMLQIFAFAESEERAVELVGEYMAISTPLHATRVPDRMVGLVLEHVGRKK